ncbi:hypothetical protein V8G54_009631 [Vigna mungo]|uniref:Uncharacterized protein n=1 Tax=Vigna mungo TaxID=3915 RepID=A0AAQ3NV72_VIGMU
MKRVKLGAENPSPGNNTKLGQSPITKEFRLFNDSDPKSRRDSRFSQFSITRLVRFGKIAGGKDFSESQLLFIDRDSSNLCLCSTGKLSLFKPLIYSFFSDEGRRSPGKDMADEQSLNDKFFRQVSWMSVMASIMDSTIGLPVIFIDFTD